MWDIITAGGLGLVLLLDGSRPDPLADMATYLDNFADFIESTAVVIGVTRGTAAPQPALDAYIERLAQGGTVHPVFEVDIRRQEDVLLLLDALRSCLETV